VVVRKCGMYMIIDYVCVCVIRDREGVTPSPFSRPDVRSVVVQVAIDGQIGYCFVVLLLLLLVCNPQRVGGGIRGGFPGSRSGLSGAVGVERLFGQPLRNRRIDLRVALHVLEPTRSPLLPLIDLIFCLGSTWANLELAFPASVIDYSMISIRFSPSNTRLPTSFFSFSFGSRMDQMKPIQITSCDRPTPTR